MKLKYTFETTIQNITDVEIEDKVIEEFFGSYENMTTFFQRSENDFGELQPLTESDFVTKEEWKTYKDIRDKIYKEFPIEEDKSLTLRSVKWLLCKKYGKFGETKIGDSRLGDIYGEINDDLVKKVKGIRNTHLVFENDFDKDFFESLTYELKKRYKLN